MNTKKYVPYLMLSPYIVLYLVFGLFPIIFSFGISFLSWDGFTEAAFAGIRNYVRLFTKDKFFYKSLVNTVIILCFNTPLVISLGLLTAVFLKDFFRKSQSAIQLINFLPCITTPVAVGLIFQFLFDWKTGFVNAFLSLLGAESVYWLGSPVTARAVVIIMEVWGGYGYMMVMFLSGLSTIPDELYEAAKIDGAKWFHSFFRITIPMLRPIFAFVITTSVINGFKLFDQPTLLFAGGVGGMGNFGGPENSVLTIVMHFYQISFRQMEFGYGSATAYVLFVIIAIISSILVRVLNRDNQS